MVTAGLPAGRKPVSETVATEVGVCTEPASASSLSKVWLANMQIVVYLVVAMVHVTKVRVSASVKVCGRASNAQLENVQMTAVVMGNAMKKGHVSVYPNGILRIVHYISVMTRARLASAIPKLVGVNASKDFSLRTALKSCAKVQMLNAMTSSVSVDFLVQSQSVITQLESANVCQMCHELNTSFPLIAKSANVLGSATSQKQLAHVRAMANATTKLGAVLV